MSLAKGCRKSADLFLADGGEAGALMRGRDWASSPLGEPDGWDLPLRTLVAVILGSRQAMFLVWGPEQTLLYNDAYAEILGDKHPAALGRPFTEVWSEIRDDLTPIVTQAYDGEPVHMDDITLVMHRKGYPEETHFAFSYTPVRGQSGGVAGLFCACIETTEEVFAKRRLVAESDHFRELFRQAPGFCYVWRGPDHVFEMANDAYFQLVGHRDIIGKPAREALPEIEGQGFFDWADRAFASGEPFVGQGVPAKIRRSPGAPLEERFVTFVFQPIRDADGRVTGLFVQGSDVTEAKKAEAALRASEARLRAALEIKTVGAIYLDEDGRITDANDAFLAMGGYSRQDLENGVMTWRRLTPPEWLECSERAVTELKANGQTTPYEKEYFRKDGSRWWALFAATLLEDGSAFEFVLDITKAKQAEKALRDLNATLESRVAERTADRDRMWRLSTDIMIVHRLDSTLTAVNPAWTATLGWSEEEVLGMRALDLVHPDDVEATRGENRGMAAGQPTQHFVNRLRHKDGHYRWFSWMAVPDGGLVHAVGRDVTVEKEREAALRQAEDQLRQAQKLEAVGQLTGGLAHDFNNLLQALGGCLAMIRRRTDEPKVQPLLDAGQQAVDRGAKLVQQLMAFARREGLRPEPIDVRDRVLAMSPLLERALRADIRLATTFGPGLWSVEVDPTQFELALINMAVNARDAMADGGLLTVKAENVLLPPGDPSGLDGEFVRLSVTDTGTGMAPEVRAKAFDPFFTTKEVGRGSGLGLAQVYGLARQGGGMAWIDSEPGRGTAVVLLLRRSTAAVAAVEAPSLPATAPVRRSGRVLLVEDDPIVASTVAAALEDSGYEVARVTTADEALPLLASRARIDLLFSDVVMPGRLSGVDLVREARRLRPNLPAVLTTGYSETVARTEGVRLLPKPYRIEELIRVLNAVSGEAAAKLAAGAEKAEGLAGNP
ncbi:PAS domain S-box protein [Azospirillum rugosum]|uniref:histidine kinase n=1 Tax=Azospirillum rugosum TaxID=416170 RepID=A0ABS4SN39_9PROT|nr:PAS domain S-box protein [Azospirillum rugosum]MBP2292795.1 PAS domain S-box-containing protein [Azospirillum rugosum]MDQ0527054.1 PAS domain S-box-containing protein [Azospirillum rugosum]